ncbi:MAG: PQQ-binding-like beta-propeller repeat protein [Rikenellaceae bacterium]
MKPLKQLLTLLSVASIAALSAAPLKSIETPYTISKVTTAEINKRPYIVASSYEGTLLCYDFDGKLLWENKLSGYFNQDIYCADVDGDGSDETFAANSDGSLYCVDESGKQLWSFRPSETPMNAVTLIHSGGNPYIVCGGYDLNIYYLDAKGKLVKTVASESYSREKGVNNGGPGKNLHIANFLRTARRATGEEVLVLHGVTNSMSARGGLYLFNPLEETPYAYYTSKTATTFGDMSINNLDPKRDDRILFGSSKDTRVGYIVEVDLDGKMLNTFAAAKIASDESKKFGYRVTQSEAVKIGGKEQCLILFGSCIILPSDENTAQSTTTLATKYAYNDITKDATNTKIILASEQGGGNCIHIFDLNDKKWQQEYEDLVPKGNITSILSNSKEVVKDLYGFKLPKWESLDSRPVVCFMSESPNKNPDTKIITDRIHSRYPSPIFLNHGNPKGTENPASWSRDTMKNEFYRDRRDRRQQYKLTQDQILKNVSQAYKGDSKGMAMWGGHGNDPFYNSPDTQRKIMSLTGDDQQTVLIFPEMEGRGEDAVWLMENYVYPLANHAKEHNSKLYIRSKHLFWLGNVYEPQWKDLVSGKYADVFVPSMEETTDKSMELSLMGRVGVWMSGAVNSWGTRCARDNASYNRLRQFSHQNLPNGFLRNMIYHISFGAQYIDNFEVDQEYMSMLWEMIAKGLLYVPKREEIVSFNPVRLSIVHPDQKWLDEGNSVKWTTLFDPEQEAGNPWVMGRLNGTWPAAPTTEWDFSRYGAGAKERRLNFISSYNNGHVMLTPPYDATASRGSVESHMHPLYKGITKEFFTDGRYYYADAERTEHYSPKEYYKVVEQAIEEGAKKLPLTVKGEVGWVAAQSAPKHLRVTIIDGGYINPSEKEATIVFGTAKVKSIKNLATGENLSFDGDKCSISIPCGLFVFLDIELEHAL